MVFLCNTCGVKADGIAALAFLTKTPWGEVNRDIAELLGVEPDKEVKKGSRSVSQSKQLQVVVPEPRVVSPEEVEKVRRKLIGIGILRRRSGMNYPLQ